AGVALRRAAKALGTRLRVAHLELRHPAAREPAWPQQSLYAGFRKRLEPKAEANMLAIPRKQRAMVRKGIKHGLAAEADDGGERMFDFGRSKEGTGPYDFKRNWGFEPAPLAYEYCLYRRKSIPENNPLNPKYRALIALWRHLPIGVANAIGPHVVKSLG